MSIVNGRVKRLVSEKGFFHRSGCHGAEFFDLREGQAVTLDRGAGRVAPLASAVIVKRDP